MNIAKETAKRMLQSIDQQLQALAAEQQSMNGNKGGQPTDQLMCFGGRISRRRMPFGGPTNLPSGYHSSPNSMGYNVNPGGNTNTDWAWQNGIQGFGNDPYQVNFNLPAFNANVPKPFVSQLKKVALPINDQSSDLKYTAPNDNMNIPQADMGSLNTQKDYNINFSNPADNPALGGGQRGLQRPGNSGSAMDWLGMLPGIFNIGAGLMSGKAQRLNPNQFQNQDANRALSMMPDQYRIDPQLNEARNAYANNIRNINNASNSRGERMANYGAASNQYNANVGQAYTEKNNMENEMRLRKAGMLNEQGQQRAGVTMGIQNMNDQNAAAARNNRMSYLGAGMSDIQKNYLVNKQMGNQQQSQMAYIQALMAMPHFQQWLRLDPNNPLGIQNNTGR
jgi:hypothetical protein